MKIAILDDWFDTLRQLPCFSLLAGHDVTVWHDTPRDLGVLVERLADTEALVLIRERTRITRELVARLPKLRLISQRGVYPHIDVAACTEHGVMVCSNTSADMPSYAAAELTWALTLAWARQLPLQVASMREGRWQAGVGRTLRGRTFGVFGYGKIGRVVAGYAKAFGMRVVVWARAASRDRARTDGHETAASQADFFAQCDVVSLHLRLIDATRGIVTADDLAAMKPGALLVNTSRSQLIAPGALLAGLNAGRPSAAALDVFDVEPLTDPADPLLSHPATLCTPHIGYVTHEEWDMQFTDVFEQIRAYAAGSPMFAVNPDVATRARP